MKEFKKQKTGKKNLQFEKFQIASIKNAEKITGGWTIRKDKD